MAQAEICRYAPTIKAHTRVGTWTPLTHVPAGCLAWVDPAPDSGLYTTQCKDVDGNWPVPCDEYTDIQFQRLGEDDGTDLVLTVTFKPIVAK
jgi:hypothetical protein